MAQAWPKAKPKLTQEAFDEAVTTNIEDFDMSREEAITSAVEDHPIAVASQGLRDACSGQGGLTEALEALYSSLQASTVEAAAGTSGSSAAAAVPVSLSQEAYVIAHKGGAMQSLLEACKQLHNQTEQLLQVLRLLQLLLGWLETRDAFTEVQGVEVIHDVLKCETNGPEVKTAAAEVAEAAAKQVEEAKCRLVDSGVAVTLLSLLSDPSSPPPLLGAACGVLRAVTTADDERPPSSRAFVHARLLAGSQHGAIRVLLGVLRRLPAEQEPATVCKLLGTVRQIAANEEICREFTDDGGVVSCLQVLRGSAGRRDVVRSCLSALRQLAHSDGVKRLLAEAGAVGDAVRVTALHEGADDVAEAALGLLGNMVLRHPENATLCAEAGVPDMLVEVMRRHPGRAPVQRQACLLTRLMAARNPELRPGLLERGLEPLLRAAKAAHPNSCKDVGSAALRDLGLDNYND
ncbi:hypothetical protein GPECTOR_4g728 [Gonium pectorale]|uniref:Armadillo repeat-containing protein 6 n=1 Tax=Gonium pectorale TaxID=33097 RepID=A0A150GY78_GONPE|nr:hypothetical protein GPECTOR_4g728 [Gonium pectorale]|eukprot:KXZ54662.1 hypothetical protein GPECTOR_4g728 [Gonium pectorale]